jgi:sulfopyruvate decarboxylase subunit alpha
MIRAELVFEELKRHGVSHVIGIPDNSSAALVAILSQDASEIPYVCVTREAEAFAVASGLWVGGKIPVVLIQNTGFLESGDSFRGTALRMRVPLVCLITYRGYPKMASARPVRPWDAENLSRADFDSAALITEPTLDAWGLPYSLMGEDGDLGRISEAFQMAGCQMRPVAVLITTNLE